MLLFEEAAMTAITDLAVAGYVQGPYEQVCRLLEQWEGEPLPGAGPASSGHVLGRLAHVSRAVARVPVERQGTTPREKVGELRILPVITGHDSQTEVLLVTEDSATLALPRSARVVAARRVLDALLARLDHSLSTSLAS
jgi:hypothetical protein